MWNEPLRRYRALRTHRPDELQKWLEPNYAVRNLDMPRNERAFAAVINHCELSALGLTYASYGSPLSADLSQNDFFVQGFPVSGAGEIQWNGRPAVVDARRGGIVGGPGSQAKIAYDGSFAHLMLKLGRTAVTRKLSALIDNAIDPPIQLVAGPATEPASLESQRRLVRFLATELDQAPDPPSSLVLDELQDFVIVAFLSSTEHNYSRHLQSPPRVAAPWQVRLAADFIDQNWNRAVTTDEIARVAGTSVRSLFSAFKKAHGVSPMVFLRRRRLLRAREMLGDPKTDTSVTEVALSCGFANFGLFAANYFAAFGEKPSETLRRRRR
jgi:AraC-like DNA-binding protein